MTSDGKGLNFVVVKEKMPKRVSFAQNCLSGCKGNTFVTVDGNFRRCAILYTKDSFCHGV